MVRRVLLVASLLVVCPLLAQAADQTVLGKQLLVKDPSTADKRKVIVKAREEATDKAVQFMESLDAMGFEFLRANDRDLLVAARLPARLRPASVAVLLCNPFGEEAVRAHRAYRVLAQRLEAAGYATLRFDYAGTGDSGGDSDAFTPDDWIDDIAAAADELRRLAGVSRIVLAGLRLGATLAAHAAQRSDVRAAHVVL